MKSRGLLLICGLLVSAFSVGRTAETLLLDPVDESRDRTVPVKVYLPESKKAAPVVLFSHGLGGSRDNNAYLGNFWASHGYVAVFIQHHGSDNLVWKEVKPGQRMEALKTAASGKSLQDRLADVPFVIDQLEVWNADSEHALSGRLDLEKIGMSGHSFGAGTTQGVMGIKYPLDRQFKEPRIDAFLLLSPSIGKRLTPGQSFGHIQAPVLGMTGTEDGSPIDPGLTPESRTKVYEALPAGDKYLLIFEGGEHHAFGDSPGRNKVRMDHHHPAIQEISVKFWDAYLRDDAEAKAWLQSGKPREDCELAEKDKWKWK